MEENNGQHLGLEEVHVHVFWIFSNLNVILSAIWCIQQAHVGLLAMAQDLKETRCLSEQ